MREVSWRWIPENPLAYVSKPPSPGSRNRLVSGRESELMIEHGGSDLSKSKARAVHAVLFAIETAMRSGEVCRLRWQDIEVDRRFLTLHEATSGTSSVVPLSCPPMELLKELPESDPVFGLLDVGFMRRHVGGSP